MFVVKSVVQKLTQGINADLKDLRRKDSVRFVVNFQQKMEKQSARIALTAIERTWLEPESIETKRGFVELVENPLLLDVKAARYALV
jgi:hypothetical protein